MPRRNIYKSSAPVLTDGEQHQFLCDSSGNLLVNVAASTDTGDAVTEDAAAAANPVGQHVMARRKDTLSTTEVSADGDVIALNATNKGALHVNDADAITALQIMDDWDESDRAKVNPIVGQAGVAAGAGAVGATVQRVTLASDDPLVTKDVGTVITVTPTLETSALDAGDVVFDSVAITSAAKAAGGTVTLDSIVVLCPADQKAQLHLVFFNAATSLGTVDAAPDIDDTELLTVVGYHEVLAASYVDLGANSIYSIGNIGKKMKTNASANLWVAAFTTGTPTYGAADAMRIQFGFIQH